MATTPNYGWVTPAPTDFVTDLPADFETFADAVDADLAGLLGGTTGQVLAKDSNADHDFSWTTLAGGDPSFTLLNTGGTALTGAQTITVSGITDMNTILVVIDRASSASADSVINVRINGNTGSVYRRPGLRISPATTYSANIVGEENAALDNSGVWIFSMSNNAGSTGSGYCLIQGCKTSGVKIFNAAGGVERSTGVNHVGRAVGGVIEDSNVVTEINLFSSTGNFDNGTLYVYGSQY